jgi:CubicO group peptidase (beta-lactamase class C family)
MAENKAMNMRATGLWRAALVGAALIFLVRVASAQNPGQTWQRFASPEQAGWSAPMLEQVFQRSGAAAMMVVQDGKAVATFGDIARRYKCHSMRKSLLSALYGLHVQAGTIHLDKTLRELRIDDHVPLSDAELGGRIVDLLRSSSGVYMPAAAEVEQMRARRPARGSHPPGSFWYYNNWDFNVLGTIFERETGRDLFVDFDERIATPLQMEDFRLLDGAHDYSESELSIHPSYPFKMSARDLARFGQLYLQRGRWNAEQVIPEQWIADSTRQHFEVTDEGPGYTGYGYLWWLDETPGAPRSFFASGYGGQYVGVLPDERVVIVLLADTYRGQSIPNRTETLHEILLARSQSPAEKPEFAPLERRVAGGWRPVERRQIDRLTGAYVGEYQDVFGVMPTMRMADYQDHTFFVMARGDELVLERFDYYYRYRLAPTGDDTFFVEDLGIYLVFDVPDATGKATPVFCADPGRMDLYRTIARQKVATGQRSLAAMREKSADPFDLELLAWNFKREGRLREAVEVLRLNVLQFSQSVGAHRELVNTMRMAEWSVPQRAVAYSALVDELPRQKQDPRLARWFHQWLDARAHPVQTPGREAAAWAGTYGDRHVVAEGGNLYYWRGDAAGAPRYRLVKAVDGRYVVDDDFLDGSRFEFTVARQTGVATMIVVSIDGRRTALPRD